MLNDKRSFSGYPLTFVSAVFVVSLVEFFLFFVYVLPSCASLLAAQGAKFNLPLRVAISIIGVTTVYSIAALAAAVVGSYLFLVFDKKRGRHGMEKVIFISGLIVTLFVQAVFLLTLFDLLPFLRQMEYSLFPSP